MVLASGRGCASRLCSLARRCCSVRGLLTERDAAYKRIIELLARGEPLPLGVDFTNHFIYYVGQVHLVWDDVVGTAGPTSSTGMYMFTEMMLAQTGLIGMIGKASAVNMASK